MKVKSVELINLKSYSHSTIELSPNINLLIGANNSGKSTIIKSLLNLQYHTFDKNDIRATKDYAKTYINLIDISEKEQQSFRHREHPTEFEGDSSFIVCCGINHNLYEHLYYNPKIKAVRENEGQVVRLFDSNNKRMDLKNFPRFSEFEDKNNFIYPFLSRRKTYGTDSNLNKDSAFRVSEGLANLAAKIQKLTNSSHPKNEIFNQLCEDILGFKIGVIPIDQNNGNGIEVGIYVTDTDLIPIKNMGDGVANIIGFLAIMLTENNKLYLIEELENDIHPTALKKLLDYITTKASDNQFVISTHSHIVLKYLGAVPNTKLFYIDWKSSIENEKGIQMIPTSEINEIENNAEKRIEILEKLGYDFQDFELYESYLLLEESTAEKVIKDFLIPFFVPKLYNKLKTIAARGVEDLENRVTDFNRLFVFIHTNPIYFKKAWVIADGDVAGKKCIENLKNNFNKWPTEHFKNFSKSNFEEYYPARFNEKIEAVLRLDHGKKKQEAKTNLLIEVMQWSFSNKEQAKTEFGISAIEVIDLLKKIEESLSI